MRTFRVMTCWLWLCWLTAGAGEPGWRELEKGLEQKLQELDAKGKKRASKVPGGLPTLKGRAICAVIQKVAAGIGDLPPAKRDEPGKVCTAWSKRLEELFKAGGRFAIIPSGTKWSALDKAGRVRRIDTVTKPTEQVEVEEVCMYLAARRFLKWHHLAVGKGVESVMPSDKQANDKDVFEFFLNKGSTTIAFFYLRSPESQKVSLQVGGLARGNKLSAAFANGEALKLKSGKARKLKLQPGATAVLLIFDVKKGGKLTFQVKARGKALELGALGEPKQKGGK